MMNSALIRKILTLTAAGAALCPLYAEGAPNPRRLESQMVTTVSSGKSAALNPSQSAAASETSGGRTDVKADKPKSPWAFPEPDEPAVPGPVRTIVIDPGHGGANEGAIGIANIHEKYLTLQLALLAADRLRKEMPGVKIVLTRQRDEFLPLGDRIELANRLNADLFLSLHFNSSGNPKAGGFESFWVHDFWEADMKKAGIEITDEIRKNRTRSAALSYRMGDKFNHAMRDRFDIPDRGVKPGNYTVLTRAEVPAVVLEFGFLSHETEGIEVTTEAHRVKYVNALVDAVKRYADTSAETDGITAEN